MQKKEALYHGKAKSIYTTEDPNVLIMHYRNDTSAFNGVKLAQLERKGEINNLFNAHIMQKLEEAGIPTHFERLLSQNESLVKNLKMIPVECVVRNVAAGSICKRLGIDEKTKLSPATYELFLKDDPLGDPMINESHAITFAWATQDELNKMRALTIKVNDILYPMFDQAGMILVDFKLEFGRYKDEIVLADEFSPDGCRIWDKQTLEKLDKDRFRQDLGDVVEHYIEVANRLEVAL